MPPHTQLAAVQVQPFLAQRIVFAARIGGTDLSHFKAQSKHAFVALSLPFPFLLTIKKKYSHSTSFLMGHYSQNSGLLLPMTCAQSGAIHIGRRQVEDNHIPALLLIPPFHQEYRTSWDWKPISNILLVLLYYTMYTPAIGPASSCGATRQHCAGCCLESVAAVVS